MGGKRGRASKRGQDTERERERAIKRERQQDGAVTKELNMFAPSLPVLLVFPVM